MANTLVLLSGGLDSTTVLYHTVRENPNDRVTALFFNYGQKSLRLERNLSKYHAEVCGAKFIELKVDLDFTMNRILSNFSEDESATDELPMRNLVFLALATSYAKMYGYHKIELGIIINRPEEGDLAFEDTTADFMLYTKAYFNTMGITVEAPLIELAKIDVLQYAVDLGVDLNHISSCNHAVGDAPCMECTDCKLLIETVCRLNNSSYPSSK